MIVQSPVLTYMLNLIYHAESVKTINRQVEPLYIMFQGNLNGLIRSSWRINGSQLMMNVVIPPNTTAEIFISARNAKAVRQTGSRQAA
ncbi:alpha-L-rhamnosidase C-terminal domain-containing protein, partial [Verrucomicrobiota bacterium]